MAERTDPSGLATLGWGDDWSTKLAASAFEGAPARVVRHDGVKVMVSDGESVFHATFPRSMQLAVGDWVQVKNETISGLLERTSQLERDSAESGPQIMAANVDLVLVVFGADRPLKQNKVLRFVAFAWDIGARPVVVVSKIDLHDDSARLVSEIQSWVGDVEVIETSIEDGLGVDTLFALLSGRTGTLIGESGAGKSSLVNALMEDEVAWIGDVRERDAKGRHTTTHRELHLLPGGGMIIDNPGIRSLGLSSEGEGVEELFADIEDLAFSCRFRDCAHRTEPGCAVLAAIKNGELARDRWNAYCRFIDEQTESSARAQSKQRLKNARKEASAAQKARDRDA